MKARLQTRICQVVAGLLLLLLSPLVADGAGKKLKIKASTNPPQYVAFSKPLPSDEQPNHALERLTFGPRPGDLAEVRRIGLEKWLDRELHPEKVPEDPILEQRLLPLETLRMSIRDTYVHYPTPQMIAAVARGRGTLPEDPELRAIVVRLADRYLQKKNEQTNAQLVGASSIETR